MQVIKGKPDWSDMSEKGQNAIIYEHNNPADYKALRLHFENVGSFRDFLEAILDHGKQVFPEFKDNRVSDKDREDVIESLEFVNVVMSSKITEQMNARDKVLDLIHRLK